MAGSWLASESPTVAIEIARGRLSVVGLSRSGGSPVVSAWAGEPLPADAVVPALTGPNIPDPAPVADALRRALDRSGLRAAKRAALVVPDSVARVSLLTFEQLPSRAADLDQLVRWQLRKGTPFPIEDAQVTYFRAHAGPVTTLAAVAARRDVIAQYEAVTDAVGIHAGLVDLASFDVMNALVASGATTAGDGLVVHVAADATTLAILRGEDLMFYRHRPAVDEEPLGALVHQTAMYHQDRLGGAGFSRVWLSGAALNPAGADSTRLEIQARLGVPVEVVDVRPAATIRQPAVPSADVIDSLAAPVGALLREQRQRRAR